MNFAEMTAPEIRALPRDSTLIIAPIAAMEQHGVTPVLPLGCFARPRPIPEPGKSS
jgi:creatinine amidohydrolase/Fe(II)-dependent formamide hydrolase-like protein